MDKDGRDRFCACEDFGQIPLLWEKTKGFVETQGRGPPENNKLFAMMESG
jgi:hypothetical protein